MLDIVPIQSPYQVGDEIVRGRHGGVGYEPQPHLGPVILPHLLLLGVDQGDGVVEETNADVHEDYDNGYLRRGNKV